MAGISVSADDSTQDCVVALVTGDVDFVSVSTFWPLVHELLDGDRRLVLDLSGVEFFDSAGLNQLLALNRRAAEEGGSLVLVNVPGMVNGLLSLTGADTVVDVRATLGEAMIGRREADETGGVSSG